MQKTLANMELTKIGQAKHTYKYRLALVYRESNFLTELFTVFENKDKCFMNFLILDGEVRKDEDIMMAPLEYIRMQGLEATMTVVTTRMEGPEDTMNEVITRMEGPEATMNDVTMRMEVPEFTMRMEGRVATMIEVITTYPLVMNITEKIQTDNFIIIV